MKVRKIDFCIALCKKSHLITEQRYAIQAYKEAGYAVTFIADKIGKGKSVVSRELKCNNIVKD